MKPLHVLALVAVAYLVGVCTAPVDTSEADAIRAQITPLLALNDSLDSRMSVLTYVADSLQDTYSADSLAWEYERAALLSRAESAESDFRATAERLRSVGDSTVDALVGELEADYNASIEAYQVVIHTLEEERDALFFQRGQLMMLAGRMREQIQTQALIIEGQEALIQALEAERGRDYTEYLMVGLAGAVIWELAR